MPFTTATQWSLHSIMFLLIRVTAVESDALRGYFTFHNVSINTGGAYICLEDETIFTFHNVSINTESVRSGAFLHPSLHSIMFLLIRIHPNPPLQLFLTLHSIMFLLILIALILLSWLSATLHSIMFLLIQEAGTINR